MEFTIEKQEEKPLVERMEVIIKAKDFEVTPSNAKIKEEAAKQLNKPADLIIVKRIHQKFGKSEAEALVYIYNTSGALDKFEPKPKKKKGKPGEKKEEAGETAPVPAEKTETAPAQKTEIAEKEANTEEAKTGEKK